MVKILPAHTAPLLTEIVGTALTDTVATAGLEDTQFRELVPVIE
jgi:hypothetical protein